MPTYIRKLEIVDEYDNVILRLNRVVAEKGLREALRSLQRMDGNSPIRRILKFFDEDTKKLFGLEGQDGKKN